MSHICYLLSHICYLMSHIVTDYLMSCMVIDNVNVVQYEGSIFLEWPNNQEYLNKTGIKYIGHAL
jgi:hypothetical protein